MEPRAVARRLMNLAAETELIELTVWRFPLGEIDSQFLVEEFGLRQKFLAPAEQMIDELQKALLRDDWAPETSDLPKLGRQNWTFGAKVAISAAPLPIHRGFLLPQRHVAIRTRVPELVVLYLITIDEGEDYLENEAHSGVGWHYHYLDWRKNRSNVVLCWDARWTDPCPQTTPPARRGLFVEKHAEKGKLFRAKPWMWGEKKRETMYQVCTADLRKRPINEFRCASNNSELVYPPGATLTPHPSSIATAAKPTASSSVKARQRRR